MNKLKTLTIIILMIFSFYLSDRITSLAIKKNPIMETINEKSESLTVMSTNATIKNNTIIPGISGKKVDKDASFFKMKEFGAFNELFFVYENIKPDISLEDNKDKIIIQGNPSLRQVSIVIDDNDELLKYFQNKKLDVTVLAHINSNLDNFEYLNSESNEEKFDDLDSILNKNKKNKKICLIEYSNIKKCKEQKYYLVSPTIKVSNSEILQNKNLITNGAIIYINKNVSFSSLKLILNQIQYLDLKIVYLSKLIKE